MISHLCRELFKTEFLDVNVQDASTGDTPLHISLRRRSQGLATAIAEHPKVNLTVKNKAEETAMHILANVESISK
jgi:ankyrin repeat protein